MNKQAELYLGTTADRLHVYANIRLEDHAGPRTLTDHELRRRRMTELSIMFSVQKRRDRPNTMVQGGQVPAHDRVIVKPALSPDDLDTIEQAWSTWHLNLMNAACDHMADMTVPDDVASSGQISWKLDHWVCPVTPYTYGHSWLARELPADVITSLSAIIDRTAL